MIEQYNQKIILILRIKQESNSYSYNYTKPFRKIKKNKKRMILKNKIKILVENMNSIEEE